GDVVFKGSGRLVRLLVYSEIINLHPEIQLGIFVALEGRRLAIRSRNARTNLHGADDKPPGSDRLGGTRFHLVGENQGRGRKLVFGELGDNHAPAPKALAVAI